MAVYYGKRKVILRKCENQIKMVNKLVSIIKMSYNRWPVKQITR